MQKIFEIFEILLHITNSFYVMHAVRHLWSNLKTCRPYFCKKGFESNYVFVKLYSENKFNIFRILLMPFCLNSYLKVNISLFDDLLPVIAWKWPLRFKITQNTLSNKRCLWIWIVDGAEYVFHKNWFSWQNFSNLRILKLPSNKM